MIVAAIAISAVTDKLGAIVNGAISSGVNGPKHVSSTVSNVINSGVSAIESMSLTSIRIIHHSIP